MAQQMSSVFDCLGPWGSLQLSMLGISLSCHCCLVWGNVFTWRPAMVCSSPVRRLASFMGGSFKYFHPHTD